MENKPGNENSGPETANRPWAHRGLRLWPGAVREVEKASGTHRRRLDRHAARARHQIKFQLDQFRRAVIIGLGADSADAAAQPALQRTERLPLQPVEWIAGRVSL